MIIHFVCRGNAFRSIIAEAYLKSLEIQGVEVQSSGTVASRDKHKNLANFPTTLALLEKHGIRKYVKDHIGDDLTQDSIDKSDILVFLNRIAYDEAVSRFVLPKNIYIWDVSDIGEKGRIVTNDSQKAAYWEDVYNEIVNNMKDLRTQTGL